MPDPLISVIIPVFNGESFLERCFLSIDAQDYQNLEIIFIDNNSVDRSNRMIQKYCKQKNNAKLLYCKRQGPAAARNTGLDAARGEYISFLDVDDEIHSEKYSILMNALNAYPQAGMVLGRTEKKFENETSLVMDPGSLKPGLNPAPMPGMLWLQQFQFCPTIHSFILKREAQEKIGFFPEDLFFGEDVAFLVKVGLVSGIVFLEQNICVYHRRSQSAVSVANNNILPAERYLQFYTKFALPYFSRRKNNKVYKLALTLSQDISFKILMKLTFILKKKDSSLYSKLRNLNYPPKFKLYFLFFNFLPYRYANYIYEIITDLFVKIKRLEIH